MDYLQPLRYHFRPQKGWINDPNGLVYFRGYYHVFYQHTPDFEVPWQQPMHWGHARTKDFLHWEELPVALVPDADYDRDGCWSGTAIVKDDVLYLFYASIRRYDPTQHRSQTVSVAYSTDGVHFEKYKGNPVIDHYPVDGSHDFRDPALCAVDGSYCCVVASGHLATETGRLLLYKSEDLFTWQYLGVMSEWAGCKYAECPSFVPDGDRYLLTASVCPLQARHYFTVMYGSFVGGRFTVEQSAEVDKGPDQYAGQVFRDHLGRNILISWMPGWKYSGYAPRDIGCMSVPRELKVVDGEIRGYPVAELQHLLRDTDPALERTATGFIVKREGREPLVYEGEITDLKLLRDGYILEIFINGGKEVYSVLL
ncbi:MAG: glycoside hydrolase family 32 protein [Clostridia bacterium]|nr:glycoside hydrolase family 32 protein [Clostridia bacterium]